MYAIYLTTGLHPKIVLPHRYQILRLVNKTSSQSITSTRSEHVVGPRNAHFLTQQNSVLNAERSPHIPVSFTYWAIETDYLDLSKALDTLDHNILLKNLNTIELQVQNYLCFEAI